jgi:NADP-dependent 3-hydroxy acid dehydrogenase YdfG
MSSILAGKVALVTGASSGIGEAIAVTLAAAGAKVAMSARRADRLADLVSRITKEGGTAIAIPGDVTIEAQAASSVEETIAGLAGSTFSSTPRESSRPEARVAPISKSGGG